MRTRNYVVIFFRDFVWHLIAVSVLMSTAWGQSHASHPVNGKSAIDVAEQASLKEGRSAPYSVPTAAICGAAVSSLDFFKFEIVETKGRFLYEGDFPIPGDPLPGNGTAFLEQTVRFELSEKLLPDYVGIDGTFFIYGAPSLDLNHDGHNDVVFAGPRLEGDEFINEKVPISALINDGSFGFTKDLQTVLDEMQSIPELTHAREIDVADFNNDGRDDILIANTGYDLEPRPGERNVLLLSQVDGNYADSKLDNPLFDYQGFTHSQTIGDIDNDGDIDIIFSDLGGNDVPLCDNLIKVLVNDGDANFSLHEDWIPPEYRDCSFTVAWTSVKLVDLNGDNFPDLVLGQIEPSSQDLVFWNGGIGDFSQPGPFPTTLLPSVEAYGIVPDIQSADLNGDDAPDLLLSRTRHDPFYSGRYIQALINNEDGSFSDQSGTYFPDLNLNGNWINKVVVIDIDRDGRKDILPQYDQPANDESQFLWLKQSTGEYRSVDPSVFPVTGGFVPIDVDNDLDIDLLTFNLMNRQQANQTLTWKLLINHSPGLVFGNSFEGDDKL